MSDFTYGVHTDGTIVITSGKISLRGIYPYVNESHILSVSVFIEDSSVSYITDGGRVTLSIHENEEELVLSTEIEGFDGIHDLEPIGAATLTGADSVWVQGFGMEGPSGYFAIDSEVRRSHGIVGLSGEGTAVAIFTTDQRNYSASFIARDLQGMYSGSRLFTAGIDLEGTTSGTLALPDIHIISGTDVTDCMTRAAEMIAAEMHARTSAPPAFHWCSWYYHYENMSQQILDSYLAELKEDRTDFRYIQLDAGYTSHIGDWLTYNHRYPGGLKQAAASILDAGYAAGIWIAPFMVGDKSDLYRDHPDWVIHNPDGSPYVRFRSYTEPKIWGNTDNDYYVLDVTHPDAAAYIKGVFEEFRSWGYTLYKTDFLLWGMMDSSTVVRYDNSKTSIMIMRDLLEIIREAIGEDSYLLGSIAPFMPCIGYMDGMRIASDMGAQWTEGAFGPANLLQELPFDNYFNNIYWQNDPDSVILRSFATHMTETETRSIALLQALSGGIITTSDPVTELTEDRKSLLRLIRPSDRVRAGMPFLTDGREEIVITHSLHDWNMLYILNPTAHPLHVYCRLDELFGAKAFFQYRFNWDDEEVNSEKSTCFSDLIPPHGSALLFVTEQPLSTRPSNLWKRETVIL